MKGKFIGVSSMGFINGKTYQIESKNKIIYKNNKEIICICIFDKNSDAWCPYQSLEAVMANWILYM